MLSLYAERSRTAPGVLENQLEHPLHARALGNALDYSLWHLQQRDRQVDSRWLAEQRVSEARQRRMSGNATGQQLSQLQEMLQQMDFELDVNTETDISAVREEVQEGIDSSEQRMVSHDGERRFPPRAEPYLLDIEGRSYDLYVRPITARPDLNAIPEDALKRYLAHLGLERARARELAARIADWRDADNIGREYGADGLRRVDTYSFEPPNAAVTDWAGFRYMAGGGPELVAFLQRHFVLHGSGFGVDPRYVAPEGLAALADLETETVERALAHRRSDEREVALGEVIGVERARRFEGVLAENPASDAPLILRVEGPQLGVEVVADPEAGTVLSKRWL